MIINHNLNAMNAQRNMAINNTNAGKSMEKLSSGLRINRAGDDAAGLAISEKMRGQIRGLDQAARNSQDGISMLQTAEGALNETQSILQRMRELAVQAGNDTNNSEDRGQIQNEINQLTSEINRIGNTTEFNTQKLLNGGETTNTVNNHATVTGSAAIGTLTSATVSGKTFTVQAAGASAVTVTLAGTDKTATAIAGKINTAASAKGVHASVTSGKLVLTSQGTNSGTTDSIKVANGTLGLTNLHLASAVTAGGSTTTTTQGSGFQSDLQIGANQSQAFHVDINDMRAKALGIAGSGTTGAAEGAAFTSSAGVTNGTTTSTVDHALDVSSHDNATNAVKVLDNAINTVSTERAKLGAFQNRLEHTINNLGTSSENLSAAESRIRDVDMAKEMMEFSKQNILAQAAQAMLAQANQQPQGVLQLLR